MVCSKAPSLVPGPAAVDSSNRNNRTLAVLPKDISVRTYLSAQKELFVTGEAGLVDDLDGILLLSILADAAVHLDR